MNFQIDLYQYLCYNRTIEKKTELYSAEEHSPCGVRVITGFILTNTSNKGDLRPAVACRPSTEEGNPGAAGISPTCTRRFRIVRLSGTAGIHNNTPDKLMV